ncbi:MAG: ABC transporter substrate-binding protein [Candidatus Methanodesulfokora sp.]
MSKALALVIVLVVVVALAGALLYLTRPAPAPPPVTAPPTAPPAPAPVYIRFAGWSAGETEMKNYKAMISEFKKANPNIEVKYEVISQMFHENILGSFAAGAAPDIFYVDSSWAQIFISKGALYPIGDKLPADFVNKFYPFLLNIFRGPDGKLYGVPKDWSILSLFYNKKILSQAGVPEPTEGWTWDDLFKYAKLIHQKTGKPGLVLQADFTRWVNYLISYGAPPPVFASAADASYFDKPEVKNALKKLIEEVNKGRKEGYIVLPSDVNAGWNGEAFGKELAAMTIEGSWTIPYLADVFPNFKYGSDWDIALVPKGPAGRATMAYTVALGVNARTEHLDEALKFIQFIEGEEGQKLLVVKMGHTLPSITTLAKDPNLWPSHAKELDMVNKYDKVQGFTYGQKTGELESKFSQIMLSAFRGEITADDALGLLKDKVVESFKG